jgi:glycosyltransferase involved in cell wall biosynthesis
MPDVALLTPYPPPGERHGGRSGVAAYAWRLAQGLANEGADVTVIAPREPGEPERHRDGDVVVVRPFERGAGALPRAAAAALGTGAPTVHLQHETFLYGGAASVAGLAPALRALRRRGSVVTMHHVVDPRTVDGEFTRVHRVRAPAGLVRAGLGHVQRTIRRHAGAIVVHEPGFAELVPDAHVVPHGIEREPTPVDRAAVRERLGLSRERLVVLSFGFLAPYKGLEAALEAARMAGPDVQLVVAGGEHPRLAGARQPYGARLRAAHGDHARFTGRVAEADVGDWFAAADVALFPYPRPHATSGPLAIALGAGTPVLLSAALARCAGAPRALGVEPAPVAIAARLTELARDHGARRRLAVASAALGRERAWPVVARRHLELYEEVSDGRRPRGRLRAAQPR